MTKRTDYKSPVAISIEDVRSEPLKSAKTNSGSTPSTRRLPTHSWRCAIVADYVLLPRSLRFTIGYCLRLKIRSTSFLKRTIVEWNLKMKIQSLWRFQYRGRAERHAKRDGIDIYIIIIRRRRRALLRRKYRKSANIKKFGCFFISYETEF